MTAKRAARARSDLLIIAVSMALAAGLVFAVIISIAFPYWLRSVPAFGASGEQGWSTRFDRLVVEDQIEIKFGHALRQPRYRHGLFGNSRAIAVSQDELGLPDNAFFNFAVGGTSFRQSVALIQALYDAGKAPDTIVISLDNHDIGFFGHVYWPCLWSAPGYYAGYIADAYRIGTAFPVVLRMVAEAGELALRCIVSAASGARQAGRLRFVLDDPAVQSSAYRMDGSRAQRLPDADAPAPSFARGEPVWPGMAAAIQADLVRLGRIASAGHKIIVYESPIAADLAAVVRAGRDGSTLELRSAFQNGCARQGIACLSPPTLDAPAAHWPDCCHAPPEALGGYIAGLLRR